MSDDPIYVSRELNENEFYILSLQGEHSIWEYGLLHLLDRGYIKTREEYGGSYLHRSGEKYEIMCIIKNKDNDLVENNIHNYQVNPLEDDLK